MDTILLIASAAALSTEAFSVLFLNGFIREAHTGILVAVVVTIALFNALMAAVGQALGFYLQTLLGSFAGGVFIGILAVLGIKLLIKSFKPKFQEMTWELHRPRITAGFALAISINAFLAGMALTAFNTRPMTIIAVFALVYALSSTIGIIAGRVSKKFFIAARLLFGGGIVLTTGAIIAFLRLFQLI